MPRPNLSRRSFLKLGGRSLLSAALAGGGGFLYAHEIEPEWLHVAHLQLRLPNLAAKFRGYRIVHITDIHMGGAMTRDHLDRVVRAVNDQSPDLVAITGDFVQYDAERFAPRLGAALCELRARDAKLAVLGNHDHQSGLDAIHRALREGGVSDVGNDVRTLRRGGAELHIAGVDSVWEGRDRLPLVLERLPPAGAAVLLAHEPDFADASAATGRFELQLSGHSHWGQVRLPLLGPPRLTWLGEKYPSGLYDVGGMLLYTTRGLGMLPPRLRFLCRPEITVIELRARSPHRA